jgi:hypothetical protein
MIDASSPNGISCPLSDLRKQRCRRVGMCGRGGEATKLGNQTPKDRPHDALDQMKDGLVWRRAGLFRDPDTGGA